MRRFRAARRVAIQEFLSCGDIILPHACPRVGTGLPPCIAFTVQHTGESNIADSRVCVWIDGVQKHVPWTASMKIFKKNWIWNGFVNDHIRPTEHRKAYSLENAGFFQYKTLCLTSDVESHLDHMALTKSWLTGWKKCSLALNFWRRTFVWNNFKSAKLSACFRQKPFCWESAGDQKRGLFEVLSCWLCENSLLNSADLLFPARHGAICWCHAFPAFAWAYRLLAYQQWKTSKTLILGLYTRLH